MRRVLVSVVIVMVCIGYAVAQSPGADASAQFRQKYSDELLKADGWLSLVALEWLEAGQTSVGSAADNKLKLEHVPAHVGVFRVTGAAGTQKVEFLAPPEGVSPSVLLDGKPAAGGFLNADDTAHPDIITTGGVQMTLIHRGDRYYLRVKDADGAGRRQFKGLHWYVYDPQWRLAARWVPTQGKTLRIVNVLGQVSNDAVAGYVEFRVNGNLYRLTPTVTPAGLFFVLRDATAKTTTDGAGRFLTSGLPSDGLQAPGDVTLDFNYAHNPPCAYTPYATCPLPPAENRLAVAIPAGEKRYE